MDPFPRRRVTGWRTLVSRLLLPKKTIAISIAAMSAIATCIWVIEKRVYLHVDPSAVTEAPGDDEKSTPYRPAMQTAPAIAPATTNPAHLRHAAVVNRYARRNRRDWCGSRSSRSAHEDQAGNCYSNSNPCHCVSPTL
jgi:hypothetical protein